MRKQISKSDPTQASVFNFPVVPEESPQSVTQGANSTASPSPVHPLASHLIPQHTFLPPHTCSGYV